MKWGRLPHAACAKPTLLILGKTQRCHLGPLLSKRTCKETEGGQAAAFNSIQKVEHYCLELRDEGFKPLVGSKSSQAGKYQQLRNGCGHRQRAQEQIPPFCSRFDPGIQQEFGSASCRSLQHPGPSLEQREPEEQSGWSDHCSELALISRICCGTRREAGTAPGRAELHKELTGKAWPCFGKNTQFPCLPDFPSLSPVEHSEMCQARHKLLLTLGRAKREPGTATQEPKNHSQTATP